MFVVPSIAVDMVDTRPSREFVPKYCPHDRLMD